MKRPIRVVQWATGNIGTRALRAVIEHSGMQLVGLYVHSESKTGRDAGDLCGLAPTGVYATRQIDEILALSADCVLYMPQSCNLDEVCRLLSSGANVVTTRGEFHNPASMDPASRERTEEACRRGNTSIHSTGSSPGFITEAMPLVLASLQRQCESINISEYADLSQRQSPELLFDLMGFGRPPPASDEPRLQHMRGAFGPSLELVASALSLPADYIAVTGDTALARETTRIAAGVVEAGTLGAQRTTVSAMRRGRAVVSFTATWFCTAALDRPWELRPSGWHIDVQGDAPLDVNIRLAVPLKQMGDVSPGYTANRAVNAVPYVCKAAPGIRTSVDLPQLIAELNEPKYGRP